ncbi:hypothetical protein MYX82_05000 [Acidobacteria bacterium AH-259-D05]|nr:hypothetical protein [Acidobacteria bacterium AH-259-D05]
MCQEKSGLLIACALKKESFALRQRLRLDCQFSVTGLGAERTRNSLKNTFELKLPSLLIFTGTAGQLDPALKIGKVVLPAEWCLEDGSCFPMDSRVKAVLKKSGDWDISDRGLTVSAPVLRAKSRRTLYQKYGAQICDMESAIALQVAGKYAVPCLAPKIVSDTADSGLLAFWKSFDRNMDQLARYLESLLGDLKNRKYS